jgi:flagellar biosynthesis protein FlhA
MEQVNSPTIRDVLRSGIGVPIGVLAVLAMMVLPLPPLALDVLFTFNIALSLVVMMAVFYVARPLDFGVFPSVLLLATLLRLALNVASTRVVLMDGHTGTDAAGQVIKSFGEFVVGGNYAVGVVVFIILTVINFVVVTKGAGRISEVTARFTLDAMPGKQMAIDADLNAGLITQDEARTRRHEVRAEADFYGSMDGASKFARGDAEERQVGHAWNHAQHADHAGGNEQCLRLAEQLAADFPAHVLGARHARHDDGHGAGQQQGRNLRHQSIADGQ